MRVGENNMQESGEMYLETILVLGKEKENVRAIDICEKMNFSKPSVSRALSKLKSDDCITVDQNGYITLSEKGYKIAEKIYERHRVLTKMLMSIGVEEKNAVADACKMEHDISDETFAAMKKHLNIT